MTQWTSLLQNLGIWDGSFTHLTPSGEVVDDVPSRVSLEGLDNHQQICQKIQMLSPDCQTVMSERVLTYGSLSRSVLVFETGAFSQGAIQYGPFSEFGAEMGFIEGDRRLRLVQLFNQEAQLATLTLIREHRQGTESSDDNQWATSPLDVDDLVGHWQGTVTILFPDLSPPQEGPIENRVQRKGDRLMDETRIDESTLPDSVRQAIAVTRTWHIDPVTNMGDRLMTEETQPFLQAILLPGRTLSVAPIMIPRQQAFALEVTWLPSPTQRQRMIRHYDVTGAWTVLALILETQVN